MGASLPLGALAGLGDLRGSTSVRVIESGDRAWLVWPGAEPSVTLRVLAVPGAVVFERRGGEWFPFGRRLPAAGPPDDPSGGRPIASAIVPLPLRTTPPRPRESRPEGLRLVRGGPPRPATALRCGLDEASGWVESATSAELSRLLAARDGRRLVLLGTGPPQVGGGVRFWGDDVLVPLGFRAEPGLAEAALRAMLGVDPGDLLLIDEGGAEVVPRDAFRPLTRAGFRLACRESRGD